MQTKVTVTPDDNGMVIRQSKNNPEYGFIVLKQSRTVIQSNPANPKNVGWLKTTNLSTLLKGKMDELKSLGFTKDSVLPGKIVVKESTTPFSEENPDQHLKIAGSTGVICCIDGEPIYRITYYSQDPNEEDVFINHDNGDAIRDANGSYTAKEMESIVNIINEQEESEEQSEEESEDSENEVINESESSEEVIVDDVEGTFEL